MSACTHLAGRLALLIALSAGSASAQTPDPRAPRAPEIWAGGSLGIQTEPLIFGVGAHVSAVRGHAALRVGYDGAEEFTLGATPTSLRSVSLSAEVRIQHGIARLSAFAGPAVVWGLGRPENGRRARYQTTGLALGGDAVVALGPGVGLGLGLTGTINPEVPSFGARVAAHIRVR